VIHPIRPGPARSDALTPGEFAHHSNEDDRHWISRGKYRVRRRCVACGEPCVVIFVDHYGFSRKTLLDLRTSRVSVEPPWLTKNYAPKFDAIEHSPLCGVSTPEGWEAQTI